MVHIGKYKNINELREIWKDCYDDSEEYIDFFMENMKNDIDMAVCIRDGKAVGVMYLLPCRVYPKGQKGYYWYAGGVLKEYRNKGVFSHIVEEILCFTNARGIKSFCFSMPELREFYHVKGLTNCYYKAKIELKKQKKEVDGKIIKSKLKPGEYGDLRNKYLSDIPHIKWEDEVLDYAVLEKRFCGGIGDLLETEGKQYGILGEIKQDTLYVEETTLKYIELEGMCDELCEMYGVDSIQVQLPITVNGTEVLCDKFDKIYTGMGDIESGNLYISLILI